MLTESMRGTKRGKTGCSCSVLQDREGQKEKSCRKIIKEEGESFGENFLVFHFVFFSIFLGYKL
jgi:hypothetical protein